MLYFKYIQSKLQYTTSQSITTLQVHITTSEAFSFFHSSLIVANACQKFSLLAILPSCEKVLKFLLQGFLTFWLAAHPWLPLLCCLVSLLLYFCPS